jgi:chondroitin AC lyase
MYKRTFFLMVLFIGILFPLSAQNADIEKIKEQLREITLHYSDSRIKESPEELTSKFSNGKFSDLNYADNSSARWHWGVHWQRLTILAIAYSHEESSFFRLPLLQKSVIQGVDHWIHHGFYPAEWWWALIGLPFEMGKIFILMQDDLGDERLQKLLPFMSRVGNDNFITFNKKKATGQNLLWMAFNHVYVSALSGDEDGLARAFTAAANEFRITTEEGIQPDYSFHQHGPLSYAFGYGKDFSLSAAQLLYTAHGTKFSFSDEKAKLISAFILQGQRWCSYRNMLEYTAMGREIARTFNMLKVIAKAAELMSKIDLDHRDELLAYAHQLYKTTDVYVKNPESNLVRGNRYFPRIDFMVQQGNNFMMTVKAVSKGLKSTETGVGENLKGYHLSRGTQFIVRRGSEYEGIFPLWDWEKIPGSLCEQTGKPLPEYKWSQGTEGNTDFVLGASCGTSGCFTYEYDKDSLSANRSWFFFENAMAMLVSCLDFKRPNPVFQSVNQIFAEGDVFINAKKWNAEEINSKKIKRVWHDSVAYYFDANPFAVTVTSKLHRGAWYDINRAESKEVIEGELFTVGIDAGKSVANGAFACVVVPNVDVKASNPLNILKNTVQQQVVFDKISQTLQFVAFEPCEIQLPWRKMTLTVTKPGIGVIQLNANQLEVVFTSSKKESSTRKFTIQKASKISIK